MSKNPIADQLAAGGGETPPAAPPAAPTPPAAPAAPPAAEPTPTEPEGSGEGEGEANNPLLKALQSERAARKELKAQLDELQKASMSDQERALAEAREAGKSEALGQYKSSLARASVTSAAAVAGFNDPADAAAHLDLSGLDPDDSDGIKAAVAELATKKPYLVKKTSSTPKIPTGQQGGGEGTGGSFNDLVRGAARR